MAITTAGELFGYKAPTAGNTVEIPIVLTDSAGAKVTGIAFDAAGMAVSSRKEGAHDFTAFPTFDTNNWAECGYGEYVIILRQSDATELALMDTEGTLTFYAICTATAGDFAKIKVNTADVSRHTVAEIWAHDLASLEAAAKTGVTAGELLVMIRAYAVGRMGIAAGVRTAYEIDGSTPIATAPLAADYSTRGAPE